jgi:hypothetical protein
MTLVCGSSAMLERGDGVSGAWTLNSASWWASTELFVRADA